MSISSSHNPFHSFNAQGGPPVDPPAPRYNAEELAARFENYKDFITFITSVLLWKRPVVFVGLLVGWLTAAGFLSMLWRRFSLLHIFCLFAASYLSLNFIIRSSNKQWGEVVVWPRSDVFGPSTYHVIIEYVTGQLNRWREWREEGRRMMRHHLIAFTYQSLSLVICLAFFGLFLSDRFLFYFLPLFLLSLPGLLFNSVPSHLLLLFRSLLATLNKPNLNNNINNVNNNNMSNMSNVSNTTNSVNKRNGEHHALHTNDIDDHNMNGGGYPRDDNPHAGELLHPSHTLHPSLTHRKAAQPNPPYPLRPSAQYPPSFQSPTHLPSDANPFNTYGHY